MFICQKIWKTKYEVLFKRMWRNRKSEFFREVLSEGRNDNITKIMVLSLYLPGTTFNELADLSFCLLGMLDSISQSLVR